MHIAFYCKFNDFSELHFKCYEGLQNDAKQFYIVKTTNFFRLPRPQYIQFTGLFKKASDNFPVNANHFVNDMRLAISNHVKHQNGAQGSTDTIFPHKNSLLLWLVYTVLYQCSSWLCILQIHQLFPYGKNNKLLKVGKMTLIDTILETLC